jgi:hypothetical protein
LVGVEMYAGKLFRQQGRDGTLARAYAPENPYNSESEGVAVLGIRVLTKLRHGGLSSFSLDPPARLA